MRPAGTNIVCVGSEWHRFPSSFFLPSPMYEVKWLDDGFRGLLPHPFDKAKGGTHSAPAFFNDQNRASSEQFVRAWFKHNLTGIHMTVSLR